MPNLFDRLTPAQADDYMQHLMVTGRAMIEQDREGNLRVVPPEEYTPAYEPMTTQEAADFLGMSRPHLVKLLDAGVIAHHKVGAHRRILRADLSAYVKARSSGENQP